MKKYALRMGLLLGLLGTSSVVSAMSRFPLQDAAAGGNCEKVEELFSSQPALIDTRDYEGKTALIHAVRCIDLKAGCAIAQRLLQVGASVDKGDISQRTPLHYAAKWGCEDMLGLLLQFGHRIDLKDSIGSTSLMEAVCSELEPIVKKLLVLGANPDLQDNGGRTALHFAAIHANANLVKILLAHAARKDLSDVAGRTALQVIGDLEWHGGDDDDRVENNYEEPFGDNREELKKLLTMTDKAE